MVGDRAERLGNRPSQNQHQSPLNRYGGGWGAELSDFYIVGSFSHINYPISAR